MPTLGISYSQRSSTSRGLYSYTNHTHAHTCTHTITHTQYTVTTTLTITTSVHSINTCVSFTVHIVHVTVTCNLPHESKGNTTHPTPANNFAKFIIFIFNILSPSDLAVKV